MRSAIKGDRLKQALHAGHVARRALLTATALFTAMGLRLALAPWLDEDIPELFAVPAVVVVSRLCGWRWACVLAAMVLAWLAIPWLPPSWPDPSIGRMLVTALALAAGVAVGRSRRSLPHAMPTTAGRTHTAGLRPQAALRYAMASTLALPFLLVPALAWTSYQNALRQGRQQADAAAALAGEHVSRLVQANAIIARQVQARLGALAEASPGAARQLHDELATLARGLPHLNSIWVIGADGYPLVSSLLDPVPRINYADREYFQFHAAQGGQVYVSRLLRTRSANELFFDISARWEGAGGQFLGVINVTLRPEYVTEFFRRLAEINPALQVTLLRTDGYVIARWPQPAEVGDRIPAGSPTARLLASGANESAAPAVADTQVRVFDGVPLAVAVSLDAAAIGHAWRREVAGMGALLLIGSVLLIAVLGLALHLANRELAALQLLASESEERRRLQESLRQTQRLDALGALTGGVAHDFNNLLGVLKNALQVMAARQPEFKSSPLHGQMERAISNGTALTRKLLSFSRSQAVAPERIDLAQTLSQIAELMRLALGQGVSLVVAADDALPAIEVDRAELELALLNIAANARGAGASELAVTARRRTASELVTQTALRGDEPAFVEIAVRDNGQGMSDEVVRRAFEPFFTTKTRDAGTGLGLSQVYGLCVQAKGSAWITSASGQGTTVHLVFPEARSALRPSDAGQPPSTPVREPNTSPHEGR